mgnify:FL=1
MHRPLTLFRASLHTPIGQLLLVTDAQACIHAIDWRDYEARMLQLLARHHPGAELHAAPAPAPVSAALEAYFAGELRAIDALEVAAIGTAFQRAVWGALRRIPVGSTHSYGQLAKALGRPAAVRAVGLCNGQNPIGVVVPCHRVIGASGALTGYAGGLLRKRWLLEHEGVQLSLGIAGETLQLTAAS